MNVSTQQTILLVDDIDANLTLLTRVLKKLELNVLMASSGEQALSLVSENNVDLILLDINLPGGMNGFEVASNLQQHPDYQTIPIIFITASQDYKNEFSRLKGYEHGALDYIQKPIDNATLLAKVSVFLELRAQKKQLQNKNSQLQEEIQLRLAIETELREKQHELTLASKIYEFGQASLITDSSGTILKVNAEFTEITGYSEQEVIGKNPNILSSGRHDNVFYKQMWNEIKTDGVWRGEIWNKRKNGDVYAEYQTITKITNDHGETTNFIASFTDITEKKNREDHIHYLAHYDSLTGLPNRAVFVDQITKELARCLRHNQTGAVLFLDLDRFKNINDSFGHQVGDEVLIQFSNRLLASVRVEDTVARISGDEFIILISDISEGMGATAQIAETVAVKIIESLKEPMNIGNNELIISTSIGISLFPSAQMETVESIIKQADTALYNAKEEGRNSVRFFNPQMETLAIHRMTMESALRKALQGQELMMYYQPKYDVHTGQLSGAEALMRWHHPDLGFVSPGDFIPIAEDSGLIIELSEWMIEDVCQKIQQWQTQGLMSNLQSISINISPRHFRERNFGQRLLEMISKYAIPPEYIELEITENIVISSIDDVCEKLNELKKYKIKVSIDDFGTGYSSISYLQKLPIDTLKIDRSFIDHIDENKNNQALVTAIIAMAKAFNLSIVAEGVETQAQLDYLENNKCDLFQGFLKSPAVDSVEFHKLLEGLDS